MAATTTMLIASALLCLLPSASAAVVLPTIYASHMVIQSGQPGELWGMAAPSSKVAVNIGSGGAPLTATASATGRFNVTMPARPASMTPVDIDIFDGKDHVILTDVLFGSVYVCSGQSNMGLPVSATANATYEIAAAGTHGPGLRIMSVMNSPEYYNVTTPQTNLSASIPWARPSSGNVAGMSAMCYYFGVEQVQRHPLIPVGMVASAWGGTDVQVWMSPKALARCDATASHQQVVVDDPLSQHAPTHNPDIGLGYINTTTPELGLGGGCPTIPSTLWNSMIAPLLPLRLTGWLWYQGESNAMSPIAYQCLFPSKINQWRADWPGAGASTPYIFVQLAPWPAHDVGLIAVQRHAQLAALELAGVGMVVGADIGDPAGKYHPIHPPWKQEIARRAASIAENLVHGDTAVPLQGPKPVRVRWDAWEAGWGDFHHHEVGPGVCSATTGPAAGYLCGGIQVEFDQAIELLNVQPSAFPDYFSGLQTGQGSGGGFELWNNATPSLAHCGTPGLLPCATVANMLGPTGDVLTSATCTNCGMAGICPCKQPMEVAGILADGRTLQLNVTFINGLPKTLKYAWMDYPTMTVFSKAGRPAPPFNVTIQASPKL